MNDVKERIRERLNLAEVVGEVVVLKPAGRGRFKGLCPFHAEKTPSFQVDLEKGYYCFGCQAKGDVFDFVMQTQGLGFLDALKLLGDRVGIEVASFSPKEGGRRKDLIEINQLALAFFRSNFGAPQRDYLLGRGLSEASIAAFELGYAPAGWDGLLKHALTKGAREDDLLKLGLIIENERGRRYDRFRERIMFPIRDGLGRLVGFSGRVLDDTVPKYMNSPESPLFRKSELLYGLDRARTAIREAGEVIVVEGYTDVIALHQTGFPNAVAALGATLTAEQAEALARLEPRVIHLAFDADEAGQKAVLSGLDQAIGRRLILRAVSVPDGKDPADTVLAGGAERFRLALANGASEVEFRFRRVLERYDPKTLAGQRAILEELQGVLRPRDLIDPVAAEMRRLVTDRLGIDAARLDAWLAERSQRRPSDLEVRGMRSARLELGQAKRIEAEIFALLLAEPDLLEERLAELDLTSQPSLSEFAKVCAQHDYDAAAVLLALRERDEGAVVYERLFSFLAEDEANVDVDEQVAKALSRLREIGLEGQKEHGRTRLQARRDELAGLLADTSLPPESLGELYLELKQIQTVLAAREAERRTRVPAGYGKQRRRG